MKIGRLFWERKRKPKLYDKVMFHNQATEQDRYRVWLVQSLGPWGNVTLTSPAYKSKDGLWPITLNRTRFYELDPVWIDHH